MMITHILAQSAFASLRFKASAFSRQVRLRLYTLSISFRTMSAMMVSESAKLAFQHAPTINEMILKFDRDQCESGIQAFGADMRQLLVKTGLAEVDKSIMYDEIAPHEDHRDEEFLIPVDVLGVACEAVGEKGERPRDKNSRSRAEFPTMPIGTAGKRKPSHCPRAPMACWRHTHPRLSPP